MTAGEGTVGVQGGGEGVSWSLSRRRPQIVSVTMRVLCTRLGQPGCSSSCPHSMGLRAPVDPEISLGHWHTSVHMVVPPVKRTVRRCGVHAEAVSCLRRSSRWFGQGAPQGSASVQSRFLLSLAFKPASIMEELSHLASAAGWPCAASHDRRCHPRIIIQGDAACCKAPGLREHCVHTLSPGDLHEHHVP